MSPLSSAEWPLACALFFRDISRRCTPRKVIVKPARRDIEFAGLSVLKPWNKITDAMIVAVENPT